MRKWIALSGFVCIVAAAQPAVRAQAADNVGAPKPPVLTVTGRGEIDAEPDSVSVSLGATAAGA